LDSLVKNRRALGISYYQAAQIAFRLNQLDEATYLLKNSLRINNELNNLANKIRAHTLMAEIYVQKKSPDLAMKEFQLASALKDSLYNMEKSGQIQEMKSVYELESKDKTIQLLENENLLEKQKARVQQIILISFAIVMVLLGLLSYVFWRMRGFQVKANKELATKNQEIELQNEEIQSQADSLHQINQLKSKLLSVISHDLRGPINNLQALLEMVTKKIVTPDEFTDLTAKLKSNLNVSQRTLENLLNWSLGQMEGIKTEPVVFNINSIIEDVAHLSEEAATRKQIIFNRDIKTPLFVRADVNQVHLILRNLFTNAIKFSKRDGEVKLHTVQKDKLCHVYIDDSGIGMTASEVQLILSSNEYFTKSGTDEEKGTGLGLLLCKDFIKRNGGDFFIDSKPMQGTRVSFTLPIA
jgi:two-component system, sensor histidine kinase and response regulator